MQHGNAALCRSIYTGRYCAEERCICMRGQGFSKEIQKPKPEYLSLWWACHLHWKGACVVVVLAMDQEDRALHLVRLFHTVRALMPVRCTFVLIWRCECETGTLVHNSLVWSAQP